MARELRQNLEMSRLETHSDGATESNAQSSDAVSLHSYFTDLDLYSFPEKSPNRFYSISPVGRRTFASGFVQGSSDPSPSRRSGRDDNSSVALEGVNRARNAVVGQFGPIRLSA